MNAVPGSTPEPDADAFSRTERELSEIATRLAERYVGTFTHATVQRYVFESYQALAASARLAAFLPALTERFADDRLMALAQSQTPDPDAIPQVLFVCDRNAARSQMAAALLAMRARGRVGIRSAGSRPAAELELEVIEAMAEIGADLSAEYPKPLTDEFVAAADIVVTVGCGDACPVLPGKRYLDWTIPDPAGQSPLEVRRIRDELDLLVGDLLTYLPGADTATGNESKGTTGMTTDAKKTSVLFVCVHNAGRSQMAAGFLTHYAGDRVIVRSAGSAPADSVNPAVLEAMKEVGIDLSHETPKVLTDEAVLASDYIITMGCGDACPVYPGKTYLDWVLTDPAGQGVEAVRPIRDEIEHLIKGLITEIDAKNATA